MTLPTVHVVGNAVLDEAFRLDALPAPGASVLAVAAGRGLGGKGVNVAVAVARAGLPTRLVAAVGRDAAGAKLCALLAAEGLGGLREVDAPTDRSLILIDAGGENAVVTTNAAALRLGPGDVAEALASARPGDLVALQLNLSPEATLAALRAARAAGCRTALNPSPLRAAPWAAIWQLVDVAFLNAGEAEALGAAELRAAGVGRVVVTLGARGATMLGPEGEARVAAEPAVAVDPTGAGDAFMAVALASALRRGTDVDARALAHGARAAAFVVARPGAAAALPSRAEMAAILTA